MRASEELIKSPTTVNMIDCVANLTRFNSDICVQILKEIEVQSVLNVGTRGHDGPSLV